MRDYETMSLALTAAETGHLVLATLHASTAAKAVDRIIDVFPTGDKPMARTMLAGSLQGVVAQTLLPKVDGGRVGAFEILVGTSAIRNLIRENQVPQIYSMIQTGSRYGMVTMEDYVQGLLEGGSIDKDTAHRTLAQVHEDVEEREEGYQSAALGGGKIGGEEPKGGKAAKSGEKAADGSYSF